MPLVINGWRICYHPAVFGCLYSELRAEVRRLKRELPEAAFREHPKVGLGASIHRMVNEIVPANPDAREFRLSGELSAFRRAKGKGLPPRYRLFWVFSSRAKTIIFLYFNDENTLRKEGGDSDPYVVFRRLLRSGLIGEDFEGNLRAWEQAHK